MKQLIFSKWYSKLNSKLFITLRKRKQCKIGETVKVIVKGTSTTFFAKCIEILPNNLDHYSDELLTFDTDTNERHKAIGLLNSFYRDPILLDTTLCLHIFVKEPKKEEERFDCDVPTVCPGDYNGNPDCYSCPVFKKAQKKK